MGGGASCAAKGNQNAVAVAKLADFDSTSMKECQLSDRESVLVVKYKGGFYAVGAKCTHYGAPLEKGSLGEGFVRCPWHGACFNITTGDIEQFPGFDSIPTYQTKIKGGTVFVVPSEVIQKSIIKPMTKKLKNSPVFVIIGSGPAAVMCAQTLRQEKFDGRILIITKDANYPYDRTKLSKAPGSTWENIKLRDPDFFERYDIEFMLNTPVTKIQFSEKIILVGDNTPVNYDKLVICSGVKPRSYGKSLPGSDLKNITTLYDLKDSAEIRKLAEGKEVVICGSSFIAMELATALKDKAKRIDIIGRSRAPYGIVLGPATGKAILNHLLKSTNGDKVRYWGGDEVKSFEGNAEGQVKKVITLQKRAFDAQLVIVAIGALPCTDYLEDTSIHLNQQDGAICVNKHLETNIEGVYAAGDVTQFPSEYAAKGRVSICHWGVATFHGKVVAKNLMGKQETVHQLVPYFWTSVAGVSVRYAGYGEGHSDTAIFGSPEEMKFCTLYRRSNKAIGIATVGCDPLASEMANEFETGITYKHDYPVAILKRFSEPPIVGEKYYGFKNEGYADFDFNNTIVKSGYGDREKEKERKKSLSKVHLID